MSTRNDDRILPLTRIIAAIIIVVLFLAFLTLYIFPTHTDTNFAWTIQPPTSAILFGLIIFLERYERRNWCRNLSVRPLGLPFSWISQISI